VARTLLAERLRPVRARLELDRPALTGDRRGPALRRVPAIEECLDALGGTLVTLFVVMMFRQDELARATRSGGRLRRCRGGWFCGVGHGRQV
jgi:hypothetical protein